MMRNATAVRYDRDLQSGRNKPLLLACEVDGESIEVVAKLAHRCERRTNALVAESIAAMFAADLDLPVPEPFIVRIDPDLDLLLRESLPGWPTSGSIPGFGSRRLPAAYATMPYGKVVSSELLTTAAEILAFDVLIDNSDRLPRNPNCLSNGQSLAIIDHELAFPTLVLARDHLGNQEPSTTFALDQRRIYSLMLYAERIGT